MSNNLNDKIYTCKEILAKTLNYFIGLIPDSKNRLNRDASNFWNGVSDDNKVKEFSHYQGLGRWSNYDAWSNIGLQHLEMLNDLIRYVKYDKPIKNILEWGPGGGANAIHLCNKTENFYGVDISEKNLNECKRQLDIKRYRNFHPIHIDINNPEIVMEEVGLTIDFFISTAVYQHFPSKEYGIKITKLAYDLLRSSSLAILQIRYDDNTNKFKSKKNNYVKNAIYFTSYKIDEFWNITQSIGFTPLYVKLNPEVNYAYFFLSKDDRR